MNYRKAIAAELGSESWSSFAKRAEINVSGFYKLMNQENPDIGWRQLLKIAKGLGIQFPTLARRAMQYDKADGKGE